MSDGLVRWPARPVTPGRVAVITVSYNTRELTALLLWSLRRILAWESLEIVVVDNALTQAMSFLASRRTELPRWVWALDSDVVVSRPDALEQAVRRAEETTAAIVGEPWWDDEHDMDRFLAYSLLIDPAHVWRDGIEPFVDGGDPAFGLLQSAKAQGETLSEFPSARDGYVIHRGRSSLFTVWASDDTTHPDHWWARDHHEPHFGLVDGARASRLCRRVSAVRRPRWRQEPRTRSRRRSHRVRRRT